MKRLIHRFRSSVSGQFVKRLFAAANPRETVDERVQRSGNLFAYTDASGVSYPGYVSINRLENGDVRVSVRGAPKIYDGVHVCSHLPGPGNCTAGGPTCNNYCNMAPEKGPMQDHPLPCTHTREGAFASFVVPEAEWRRLRGEA
jgi:hypothetical protein